MPQIYYWQASFLIGCKNVGISFRIHLKQITIVQCDFKRLLTQIFTYQKKRKKLRTSMASLN